MLDKWSEDIWAAIRLINGQETSAEVMAQPALALTANNALFSLMKSYLFDQEFAGATLSVLQDGSGYSWVTLPEAVDPDIPDFEYRVATRFNVMEPCFQEPEYLEDGEEYIEPWPFDPKARFSVLPAPMKDADTAAVLSHLATSSPYYAMLLQVDQERQAAHLSQLAKVEYMTLEGATRWDVERLSHMTDSQGGNLQGVLGHQYVSSDERPGTYILAINALGPVGILLFYDYDQKAAADRATGKLGIDFVSVAPRFRRQGISSELMRRACQHSIDRQKYLVLSSSSEFGKAHTERHFIDTIGGEFPELPFLTSFVDTELHVVTLQPEYARLTTSGKWKALKRGAKFIEDTFEKHRQAGMSGDTLYGSERRQLLAAALPEDLSPSP